MAHSLDWSMRTRAQEESFPLRGAVCLAEPDEAERKRLAQIMRRMGLVVHETGSGAAASFLAAQTRLQAMVMNLLLRDAKTLVLIRQLRRMHPDMRIVALMPAGMEACSAALELARVAGADAALQAPVAPGVLARALSEPRRAASAPLQFGETAP